MIRITMLGTSAAIPTVDRNVAGIMVQREGALYLFDCGEGTQRQMMRYGVGFTVDDIFLTHYHADHTLGLPGLLRTMGLQGRTATLRIYGPAGAERQLAPLIGLGMDRQRFPVEVIELHPGDGVDMPGCRIVTAKAVHKGPCLAYALIEPPRLGRFDPELARGMGIPEGPLWGRIHRGESITLADGRVIAPADLVGPSRPGRRLVYSGDSAPCPEVIALAREADLLIHEATFGEDEAERARETFHATARDAARVAREAQARRLVLTHISARYSREAPELLREARKVFPETIVGRDGLALEVPYPDEEPTPT